MNFDKERVYSAADADRVKIGSIGYFADSLSQLKTLVEYGKAGDMHSLTTVYSEDSTYRFSYGAMQWNLFYLIEEREEETCTNKELSKWLAQGKGECKHSKEKVISTHIIYPSDDANKTVRSCYLVKKWDDEEWHMPTRDYIGVA